MSGFDSRLIHMLVIERATAGAVDEYNNPTQVWATLAVVPGRVQAKSGRELAQLNDAGPVRGEFRVFMRPTDVLESDHLILSESGEIYEIGFVAPRSGAGIHHLELDCNRVWPA